MGTGPLKSFTLKVLTPSNQELAMTVARALPEWFTAHQLHLMSLDLIYQRGAVAMIEDEPIGFISFFVNQARAEIGWMGVIPAYQNQGVGKFLINKLIQELTAAGAKQISIKTLAESIDHNYYASSREFFRNFGFKDAGVTKNPAGSEFSEELLLTLTL